jgi:trimeric autotransporter adhesin
MPAPTEKRESEALRGLRAVRGVSWQWRDSNPLGLAGSEAGVIAQEVEAVFPELVSTDAKGFKTVSYGGLVAVLI